MQPDPADIGKTVRTFQTSAILTFTPTVHPTTLVMAAPSLDTTIVTLASDNLQQIIVSYFNHIPKKYPHLLQYSIYNNQGIILKSTEVRFYNCFHIRGIILILLTFVFKIESNFFFLQVWFLIRCYSSVIGHITQHPPAVHLGRRNSRKQGNSFT